MKRAIPLILVTLLLSAFVGACGGGGGGGEPTQPTPTTPPESPAGIWGGQSVSRVANDVFTSFEFSATGGFTTGATPYRSTYSSGTAQTVGNTLLYHSGLFAWHILNGSVATVTFETMPNTLSFWVRTANISVVSNIDIFDENGILILNVPTTNAYQMSSVVRGAGQTLIGSMVVTNTSGGDVVMDDLTFGYSGSGFAGSTDNITCLVSELMETACVITDPTTDEILVSAAATLQIANVTQASGTGSLYASPGLTLINGKTVVPLTITAGTIAEGITLDLTVDGAGSTNDVAMVFDATYNRGSALATIAAVYTSFDIFGDPSSFTIDAAGVITGQSNSGCVLNGQVAIIDAMFNVYDVTLDVASCGGLDGTYDGLGSSQDGAAMDDLFVFAVFTAQSVIVGEAQK